MIPILLKLFQKVEEEGILSKTFSEANITLVTKPDNDTTKRGNYRPISLMNIDTKILKKILTESKNISKISYTMTKCDSPQGHKDGSTYANQTLSYTTLTKKKKRQKPLFLVANAEKTSDKHEHLVMIKTFTKQSIEGT